MTNDDFVEICFICEQSVAFGSGRFVNRIPAFRAPEEQNAYICEECETSNDEIGYCDECDAIYDVASRDGRCGDCGNCGNCCEDNINESEGN
jgi:hypothetical protein